jgi:hypothetical protein
MIAGVTFTTGESPRASAEAFLQRHGHLFGQMELVPGSLAGDGLAERPIMPTADGSFKHTIVSYLQRVGEVPRSLKRKHGSWSATSRGFRWCSRRRR